MNLVGFRSFDRAGDGQLNFDLFAVFKPIQEGLELFGVT